MPFDEEVHTAREPAVPADEEVHTAREPAVPADTEVHRRHAPRADLPGRGRPGRGARTAPPATPAVELGRPLPTISAVELRRPLPATPAKMIDETHRHESHP
ncbi:MAG: hypothetical protein ACJ736_12745 [Streptomyces sp.]